MERAADDCLDGEPDYPPTVKAPPKPLSLPMYFLRFVQNPLSVMPAMVYREPIVKYGNRLAWVTDLGLVKCILLDDRENFPKTRLEQRTLAPFSGKAFSPAADPSGAGSGRPPLHFSGTMLTLLVGGHETTAKALAWALYMVARLLEEIESVAGGGPIKPEHIAALKDGTRFFKEAMRLYPPVSP